MAHADATKSTSRGASSMFNFSKVRFFFLWVAGLLILTARRPEGIFRPQFFAEDGAVFFRDAYQLAWHQTLFLPHAGYHNFIPRLLAEIATLCPLQHIPLFYATVSLLVASLCLSWIYIPSFRHLISKDWIRLLLAVLFFLMPNQESLMKLSYLQWYLLFWLSLCCCMEMPRRLLPCIFLLFAMITAFCTAAISFILLPLWLLRIVYDHDRRRRIVYGAIAAAGLSASIVNYLTGSTIPPQPHLHNIGFPTLLHGLFNGIAYKVVCSSLLDARLTHGLFKQGWQWIYLVCSALLFLLVLMGRRISTRLPVSPWILVYLIIASVSCFMIRPSFLRSFVDGTGVMVHGRYFFLATSSFYLLLCVICTEYQKKFNPSPLKKSVIAFTITLFTILHLTSFRMPHMTYFDLRWAEYAKLITSMERQTSQGQEAAFLVIPINPRPWTINLQISRRKAVQ